MTTSLSIWVTSTRTCQRSTVCWVTQESWRQPPWRATRRELGRTSRMVASGIMSKNEFSCWLILRFGHLDNLSLVGTASEEAGGYFPDILDMLDEIPIVRWFIALENVNIYWYCDPNFGLVSTIHFSSSQTLPWGEKSVLHEEILRNKSNDGPILWIR